MSVPRPDTWMPLYVGDYLADTMHLSTEQHGAYMLLLMAGWRAKGVLPGDDEQLAAIVRLPVKRWREIKATIASFFCVENGRWTQKRQLEELNRAVKVSDARSAAGRKGVAERERRKQTGSKPDATDDAKPDAKGKQSIRLASDLHKGLNIVRITQSQSQEVTNVTSGARALDGFAWSDDGPPSGADDGAHVAWAFHRLREVIFEIRPPARIGPKELSIARGWIERGATFDGLRDMMEEGMRRMERRAQQPPAVIGFFNQSADELIRRTA